MIRFVHEPEIHSRKASTGLEKAAFKTGAGAGFVRLDIFCLSLLLGLWIFLWLPRLAGPLDLRFDGSVYYILGTSLAEGKGYCLLNEPGEIKAIQYPPLLPLVVAAHQWVLGTSDYLAVGQWLRLFYFMLFGGFVLAVYLMVRWYLAPPFALLAALICTLSLNTYYLSDALYSEIPFALVTTLFVIFNRKSERIGYGVLSAIMAMAAYLLRTAGIALLVAWVTESLLERRYKLTGARVVLALLPVLVWQGYIKHAQGSPEYTQPAYEYQRAPYYYSNVSYMENSSLTRPFVPELGTAAAKEMSKRIATNLITTPVALGEAVSMPIGYWKSFIKGVNKRLGLRLLPPAAAIVPIVLLGCLVVGGACLLAIKGRRFVPLYFAASVGLICLSPWPEQFTRYFMPLTPFLALFLIYVLAYIDKWCAEQLLPQWKKVGFVFAILLMASVLIVQGWGLAKNFTRNHQRVSYFDAHGKEVGNRLFFYYPSWKDLDLSLEWLRRQADTNEVIATSVPHQAFVRTGLKAVLVPMEPDVRTVRRLLDSVPVKYVVLDELVYPGISQRYAAPAVENDPARWKLIYVTPGGGGRIYERVP